MVLDKLFRIPPVKKKSIEDSSRSIVVEHRIGRMVAFFTKENLLRKTGLEKEWADEVEKLQARITNKKLLDNLTDSTWDTKKRVMKCMVTGIRSYWNRVYAEQGCLVRASFVPVEDGKLGFYIQALVDMKTRALVMGDPEDLALWNEVTAIREKSHVNSWNEAMLSAKALLKLPSLNKDIQSRMKIVLSGDVPMSVSGLLTSGDEKDKAGK
jgi:hypothetical protein